MLNSLLAAAPTRRGAALLVVLGLVLTITTLLAATLPHARGAQRALTEAIIQPQLDALRRDAFVHARRWARSAMQDQVWSLSDHPQSVLMLDMSLPSAEASLSGRLRMRAWDAAAVPDHRLWMVEAQDDSEGWRPALPPEIRQLQGSLPRTLAAWGSVQVPGITGVWQETPARAAWLPPQPAERINLHTAPEPVLLRAAEQLQPDGSRELLDSWRRARRRGEAIELPPDQTLVTTRPGPWLLHVAIEIQGRQEHWLAVLDQGEGGWQLAQRWRMPALFVKNQTR